MKKLFCKIGVIVSLFAMLLFYFSLAYGTMPVLAAICGTVLGFLSMRFCWNSFVRLELTERRRTRRNHASFSHPAPFRNAHAA